ncbi:hypothetical protein Bca4012_049404 [Brassica carinata]
MALRYDISGPRTSSSFILGRNGSVSRPRDLTTMGLVRGCNPKYNFVFPRSFISNSFLRYSTVWEISPEVPRIFRSSTYTAMIMNSLFSNFLMKIHGLIGSFLYPSFTRYSLSLLYHIRPDCFSP